MTILKRNINNQRKIIDRTPSVNVTIFDKTPIPSSRGVDSSFNESERRTDIEETYGLKQIIDNENGPVVIDKNSDIFQHVERINAIIDNDDDDLAVILKPNGVFDETIDGTLWTNEELISSMSVDKVDLNTNFHIPQFDRRTTYASFDIYDAIKMISDRLLTLSGGWTQVKIASAPRLFVKDIPTEWDIVNYPVYLVDLVTSNGGGSVIQRKLIHKFHPTKSFLYSYDEDSDTFGDFIVFTILDEYPGLVDYEPEQLLTYQLRWSENGLWLPKEGEPYPSIYENGVSQFKCRLSGDTERTAMIRPAAGQGFMIYEVDTADIPIGPAYVFGVDRTLLAVIGLDQIPSYIMKASK